MSDISADFSRRACSVCRHPESHEITRELQAGASVSALVKRLAETGSPLSRDAVYRHLKASHGAGGPEVVVDSESAHPALTLAGRIASIADAARAARTAAYLSGNLFGGARAGDAELKALLALADRLGVDHDEVQAEIRSVYELAKAVGQAARREPAVGEAVAARLEANNRSDIADELRKSFPKTSTREVDR